MSSKATLAFIDSPAEQFINSGHIYKKSLIEISGNYDSWFKHFTFNDLNYI